ncbi:hypothetical protein [Chthonobacter albigriseus]|uniref:hypothetical protein n=1 Tax=Chthonobacter albigriseus TaxID=1683161 RepID=UPI0015EFA511|nr:hypothetical protein [Chthonobacter albigriseus]
MTRFVSAICLLACVTPGVGVALADTISRETLERRFLDSCVYQQFGVKDINRQKMIENCRCATKTAMATQEGDSFQEPRSGGLTGPQTKTIQAAIAACFKPS